MQNQKPPEERAMEAVKSRNENHTDFTVGSVIPRFLHGTLYIILFKDVNGAGFENYAFVPDEDETVEVYRNSGQLTHAVSLNTRHQSILDKLASLSGISGVIALFITLTICYLTISSSGNIKVPDVLSNALTMVLGFYFGAKSIENKG